jgi:hypothetical protein
MVVDRMLMRIKRLITCLSINIIGYEESQEDLFVNSITGRLILLAIEIERYPHLSVN